jgi:hypothetical protein
VVSISRGCHNSHQFRCQTNNKSNRRKFAKEIPLAHFLLVVVCPVFGWISVIESRMFSIGEVDIMLSYTSIEISFGQVRGLATVPMV